MRLRVTLEDAFYEISHAHQREMSGWGVGAFPYIMLGSGTPEYGFDRVIPYLKPGMRVVDVGCGAGDKLLRFNEACNNLHITGIELDPVMVKVARYVTRPYENITVVEGNAFAQDYSKFDLIYMYWPIPDSRRQADLQWLCMETMKSGARLVVFSTQQSMDYPVMGMLEGHNYNGRADCGWVKP